MVDICYSSSPQSNVELAVVVRISHCVFNTHVYLVPNYKKNLISGCWEGHTSADSLPAMFYWCPKVYYSVVISGAIVNA